MKAQPPLPQASPSREDLIAAEAHDEGEALLRPPTRHRHAIARFSADLAKALGPHLGVLRHSDLSPRAVLEDALIASLGNRWLTADLAAALEELDAPLEENTVLRGDIARMPLAEVLQLCLLRRQTGTLRLTNGEHSMIAALRDGDVDLVFASGAGGEFRLGRFLLRLELLSHDSLDRALDACVGKAPLGEWLVRNRTVGRDALDGALRQQSAELVYEMMRWTAGRFTLTVEPPWPEAERARLGLGLGAVILEGCRRLDEWREMESVAAAEAVFVLDAEALASVRHKFGPIERAVSGLIDGKSTVQELLDTSHFAAFDVVAAVCRLVQAKVARLAP